MLARRLWFPLCATLVLISGGYASLLSEILDAFENAVDCASCHALLSPIQILAHLGNDAFVDTIVTICKDLGIEDADVCAGAIGQQGPILAHSLRQISVTGNTATLFCDAVFGLCQPPAVNPFNVSFAKPAPADPPNYVSSGRTPFQVLHFSDVHIDRNYTTGAEVNCSKPLCCRNYADQTGSIAVPAGPNGEQKCDSPPGLANSIFTSRSRVRSRRSIFDIHRRCDRTEAVTDLNAFNGQMTNILSMPVFGVIGNHDTAPVNSFPRNTTSTIDSSQWVYDLQSQAWQEWINATSSQELHDISGSYSVVVNGTNLRLISLNTNYWYKQNFWLYDSDTLQPDPNAILEFLANQLQAAEDAGQRAWLFGHMPMGKADVMHDQSNYYDQIIQRYKNTIKGQFFGHTHADEFEIAYSDYDERTAESANSIAFICPALTPTSGNPAFKVYDIDPDTYEVMDARTYFTNISDPFYQVTPVWKLYYSARDFYGPLVGNLSDTDSLSPAFWHNLTEVFVKNDTNTMKSRGGKVGACEIGSCKNTTICDLRSLRSQDNCDTVTPGVSFKREEEIVQPPASDSQVVMEYPAIDEFECNGQGISRVMKKAIAQATKSGLSRLKQKYETDVSGLPSGLL